MKKMPVKKLTLKRFLLEDDENDIEKMGVESTTYGGDDQNVFKQQIKEYNKYKSQIVSPKGLQSIIDEIGALIETAEQVIFQETEEWFDNITVTRHMKVMKDAFKVLEKTAEEKTMLDQRLETAYDDIGRILEIYYDLGDGKEMNFDKEVSIFDSAEDEYNTEEDINTNVEDEEEDDELEIT
jgi:hypothetical protein